MEPKMDLVLVPCQIIIPVKNFVLLFYRRMPTRTAPIAQPSDAQPHAHSNNLARLREHILSLFDKIPEDMGIVAAC